MNEAKTRFEGVVVWFNNKPGFGFIGRVNEPDIFVHFSGINCEGYKTIKKDQKVTFSISKNNRGQDIAVDVVVEK